MQDSFSRSNGEQSVMQLVVDQLEGGGNQVGAEDRARALARVLQPVEARDDEPVDVRAGGA